MVKLPLGRPSYHTCVPGFESLIYTDSRYLLMHTLGGSRRWLKCLGAPGFHLVQPWLLQTLGEQSNSWKIWKISLIQIHKKHKLTLKKRRRRATLPLRQNPLSWGSRSKLGSWLWHQPGRHFECCFNCRNRDARLPGPWPKKQRVT